MHLHFGSLFSDKSSMSVIHGYVSWLGTHPGGPHPGARIRAHPGWCLQCHPLPFRTCLSTLYVHVHRRTVYVHTVYYMYIEINGFYVSTFVKIAGALALHKNCNIRDVVHAPTFTPVGARIWVAHGGES